MATEEALRQAQAELAKVDGVTVVDITKLPAPLDAALKLMLKKPLSLSALSAEIQLPLDETHQIIDLLIEKGFVKAEEQSDQGGQVYKVYLARVRKHNLPTSLADA